MLSPNNLRSKAPLGPLRVENFGAERPSLALRLTTRYS